MGLNYSLSMYSVRISTKDNHVTSYSITREKGSDLHYEFCRCAYSRNKRGIAGSLIWINFDRHALLSLIQQAAGTFLADADEIRPQFSDVSNGSAVFQSTIERDLGPSIGSTINQLDLQSITSHWRNQSDCGSLVFRPGASIRHHVGWGK